ncbi:MAG: porin family protein [Bacteroidales bacterium]|nr:porin family protein [Bacteroidales bacterium]
MKKLVIAVVALLMSISAFAQQGDKAIGVNLVYGSEIKNIGLGIKGQYFFLDNVRGEASFNYFMKKDNVKLWELNANAHYMLGNESMWFYPLAGFNLANVKAEYYLNGGTISDSESKLGLNLGAGIQFPVSEMLDFTAEAKYVISDYDQFVIGIGLLYKF